MGATGQKFAYAEGSMSKLKAGRLAVWTTERAIQILGGNGYTREYPVERMDRDAKVFDIFEESRLRVPKLSGEDISPTGNPSAVLTAHRLLRPRDTLGLLTPVLNTARSSTSVLTFARDWFDDA